MPAVPVHQVEAVRQVVAGRGDILYGVQHTSLSSSRGKVPTQMKRKPVELF
jgi:hypothetical protein